MNQSVFEQHAAALAEIKASQAVTAALVAAFEANAPRALTIPAATILLGAGEHYAGLALDADGKPSHHLVLLADTFNGPWDAAVAKALELGGYLPSRLEQALLFANLKSQFEESYHWSAEQHAGYSDYAWMQNFGNGNQNNDNKSNSRHARFVRRSNRAPPC